MSKPQKAEFISNRNKGMLHREKVKLKDPKTTLKRLLSYLGNKKIGLIYVILLSVITTIVSVSGTRLNGAIIDKYIAVGDMSGLLNICKVLIVMYLIGSITLFLQNRIMIKLSQKISSDIRSDLFKNMQRLPLKYFDTNSSGDLMSRLTNDVDNINTTLSQSTTQFVSGIINIFGMLIAMLALSPQLALVGLITTPIMFIVTKFMMKMTQPHFVKQQSELGKLNGYIEEIISGQKPVILFSKEDKVIEEFKEINKNLTHSSIFAQALSGSMPPIMNTIGNLTYLIISLAGGYFILSGMDITVGTIFTIILYMRSFNRPINEMLNIANTIQSSLAGAERVFEVIDEEKELDHEDAKEVEEFNGDVKLENVSFSYNEDKKILKNINIETKKGQSIAIVGPTGSGKTTVINLLNKFYNVDSGKILIDNKDIKYITKESLRNQVSIVLQDTYLFSTSVFENIRYAKQDATREEVVNAAKLAHCNNFIMQLPNGYDTVLSDNGSNLSHGQRQLLAIARAIISKSSILILDEATSSIDTKTEVDIQKAMNNLMKGKTTFIIAHRLSTIKNADKILALKDGEIIESGSHDELIKEDGFYAGLYNSQYKVAAN